ncbi:TlpA family protein disulfide reductase [Pseudoxanthomonas daejeonensis]|uniref:TlpA family protein disulfide reductase n=1 Tax=Pseudoxanthomonas daejeonensis TaxID=266062 RepID=UPI001F547265|nr:TlpA disulfide reductase family protein [Pseudoxanthomonas daejeonensis]UNK58289.1 TlpA family protein disulfide reductase [Pseudoxanthomonas daejeonensis]
MSPSRRLLLVAAGAGAIGLLAGLWHGRSPLQDSEAGQRALQAMADATAPKPPAGVQPARPGDPLPDIRLPGMDGKIAELAAIAPGRPLLVNVWASWCGPCVEEMPELQRYARAQGPTGVQVVGLALDTPEGVAGFLARVPVDYPILLETPGPADASVWLGNTRGLLPYTVLVDASGRVVKQKLGPFEHGEIEGWARH